MTPGIPTDLRAWHLAHIADGIALVPPSGLSDGVVRIRDLRRPLRSAAAILARANTPALTQGTLESLITSEGEYAAFQVQRGVIDGQRVVRFVGAVLGDDAYTLVIGLTTPPHAEVFELVARTCVTRCSLGLGHKRQRRFRYAPPQGWTETAWGLASRYLAADGAELVVHPAQPSTPTELVLDAIRARYGIASMEEIASPSAPCLARMWRTDDLCIAILDDGRFRYALELVGSTHHETFERVISSVRLVPPVETPPLTDAILHWVE
jgi:hypothetical protein